MKQEWTPVKHKGWSVVIQYIKHFLMMMFGDCDKWEVRRLRVYCTSSDGSEKIVLG